MADPAVSSTLTTNEPFAANSPPLRRCNGCGYWHSKPCGEGCVLSPCDPTFEEVSARARAAIDAIPPGRSTMTGGFACPECGGTSHDNLRCTGCGFSPLDEAPDHQRPRLRPLNRDLTDEELDNLLGPKE